MPMYDICTTYYVHTYSVHSVLHMASCSILRFCRPREVGLVAIAMWNKHVHDYYGLQPILLVRLPTHWLYIVRVTLTYKTSRTCSW